MRQDAVVRLTDPCRFCGGGSARVTEGVGPHHAGLRCTSCGRHLRWLPKPREDVDWGAGDDFDVIDD